MRLNTSTAGLLVVLALSSCSREPAQRPGPPEPKVEGETVAYPPGAPQLSFLTVEAAQPRLLAVRHLTGRLTLAEDATVRIFTPVAGQVTRLNADVGQAVAAAAPLAEISSPDFGQALADARADEAALSAATKTLARVRDLMAHGAAAQKDVESAEAAHAAALAERDRSAARLKLYRGSEGDSDETYVLRSPIEGTVIERNVNAGQEVRADQMLANATNLFAPLFVVSDTARLWVQLDATEADLSELHAGERIRVTTNAFPGRSFGGTVTNIAPSLDPGTRTAKVRGVVENPDGLLKAEMYVLADVVRDESKVPGAGVEIPSRAVFAINQDSYLFVEVSPGKFERRKVEVAAEKDGRVPVVSGLAAGERVVSDGALLLQSVLEPSD